MDGLGKREHQDDYSGSVQDSDEDAEQYQTKRQKVDSGEDEIGEDALDDPEVRKFYEELMLKEKAKQELLNEDEMLKHLSKDELEKMLNQADDVEDRRFDKLTIKKMIASLRQVLNENQEKRAQHANEPEGFLDSEAELHAEIKGIQAISAYPESIEVLVEILEHQNPDISVESVILLEELTEQDLLLSNPETQKTIDILIQNEVWNFLIRIIVHLDDIIDEDRKQIFRCLSLLENLIDVKPSEMANKLMHADNLIDWLLKEIEEGEITSENHLLSAELLSSIIANCHDEYKVKFTKTLNGMERILGILNTYRKHKHIQTEEEHEAMVNLFDILSATLLLQENLDLFRKLQAFELLLNLSKKQKWFRRHIIKVLDYALSTSQENKKNCRYFVECGGLSTVFAFFIMKEKIQTPPKKRKNKINEEIYIKITKEDIQEDEEHSSSILLSLLINTAPEIGQSDVVHDRVLFKFIENNYEKLQRLIELHLKYYKKIEDFDLTQFKEIEEIEYLVADYNLNTLQIIDTIIGFLYTSVDAQRLSESNPIKDNIQQFFSFNYIPMPIFTQILRLYQIRFGEIEGQKGIKYTLDNIINQINI